MNIVRFVSLFLAGLLNLIVVSRSVAAVQAEMELVSNGKGNSVVIGERASWLERHAAEEFTKYIDAMTGTKVPLRIDEAATAAGTYRTFIGTYQNHPGIKRLRDQNIITEAVEKQDGNEFFLISFIKSENILVLTGNSRRAVLWAVYDLLERECGVGFFFEGDYIPKHKSLAISVASRKEGAYFPLSAAAFMSTGTNIHYSNWWRSAKDWEQGIDWLAKKKFPGILSPTDPKLKYVRDRIKQLEFGAFVSAGPFFRADEQFRKKFPDAHYVKYTWLDYPPKYVLHQDDPLFEGVVREELLKLENEHGNIQALTYDPFMEQVVHGMSEGERRKFLASNCIRVAEIVRKVLPKAAYLMNSWAFHARQTWDVNTVRAAFDGFPSDMTCGVFDWSSDSTEFYRDYRYFWGKPWVFGVYSSDGPSNIMKTDLGFLGWQIHYLAKKWSKDICDLRGVAITSESNDRNHVVHEYAAKLAWSPDMDLESFLRYYALHRYGKHSSEAMLKFWKELTYGPHGPGGRTSDIPARENAKVLGLVRPDRRESYPDYAYIYNYDYLYNQRALFVVPAILQAMAVALPEAEHQRDNYLYKRDMVETMLQLLMEIYTQHHLRMEAAFTAGDSEKFEQASGQGLRTLELAEELLESTFNWPDFSFAARWKAADHSLWGRRGKSEAMHWMTGYRTRENGEHYIDDNRLYWKLSMYEVIRDLSIPWQKAYRVYLRTQLAQGNLELPTRRTKEKAKDIKTLGYTEGELAGFGYRDYGGQDKGTLRDVLASITLKFVEKPFEKEKVGALRSGDPIPATRRILAEIQKDHLAEFDELLQQDHLGEW